MKRSGERSRTGDGEVRERGSLREVLEALRVFAVDESTLRVPDTQDNATHLGRPSGQGKQGDSGYPVLRLVTLLDVDTRMAVAANTGCYTDHEGTLAAPLFELLPATNLVILDRHYNDIALFHGLRDEDSDKHLLIRARMHRNMEVTEELPDGSDLVALRPSAHAIAKHLELHLRMVEYAHEGCEPVRLLTSLQDPERVSAEALVQLYRERWEIELAFDESKTDSGDRKEAMRSKTPEGVTQELYGQLTMYSLIRYEMALAAREAQMRLTSVLSFCRSGLAAACAQGPSRLPEEALR